jgi:MFS family permease
MATAEYTNLQSSEHGDESSSLSSAVMNRSEPSKVEKSVAGKCLDHMYDKFSQLKDCPYELYINFFLKFSESYGYFTLSQILVLYLHEEYALNDIQSGMIYGFWGASITFWGFITSCFNDALGVRRSLLFGFAVSFFANIVIATSTSIEMLLFILFAVLPVGNSIGIPMLTVGIKRYTTSQNRGFAYGLFYAVMNIAALVSGPVIDFFNVLICPSGSACSSDYYSTNSNSGTNSTFSRALDSFNSAQGSSVLAGETTSARRALSFFNIDLSPGPGYYQHPMRLYTGNRLVIWSIGVVYFFAWIVTFFYLREIKVTEEATIGSEGPNVTATDSDLSRTGRKRTDFDLEDVVGAASEEDITTPETLSRKALLSPSARQTLRATGRQQQVYSPLTQHQEGQNGSLHHRRSVGNRLSPSHSHSSHGNGPGSDEDKPVEVMLSPMHGKQRSGTGGPHSNLNNFRNSSLDRAGGPADQPSCSSR